MVYKILKIDDNIQTNDNSQYIDGIKIFLDIRDIFIFSLYMHAVFVYKN